jgi:LDH2 family malate/lactate/ureidoglycolate dehydrogenase/quinol monooxygenase YgiN
VSSIDLDRLTRFGADVLTALGVPPSDATLVSDSLVTADIWGHPSHGMRRLPWYAARLRSGAMRAVTQPRVVSDVGAVVVLDGQDGVGQVVTHRACQDAVRRAAEFGVSAVAVRNSNHFGTAAYWTRQMAAQGCVGILTTNGSPAMAPWGGRETKTVGANPWSIATPGPDGRPVVLDIANTGVARGKIYAAAERGQQIPDHWAIDADGHPTTDPAAAIAGFLAPMAGHKGYGISFMMDVLSGVLTGSSYATDVVGPYVPDQRSGCGHRARRGRRRGRQPAGRDGGGPARPGRHRRCRLRPDDRRGPGLMFTVLVNLQVRPERIDEFLRGIQANARASLRDEPGCLRFDVHRSSEDAHRFLLYEIYADEAAFYEAHRAAPHYAQWREVAAACVYPGGHWNTFATPAFPSDLPEFSQLDQHPDPRRTHP